MRDFGVGLLPICGEDACMLANVLFTYELARRLQATAVTANALHPGVVNTSFGADDPAGVQRLLVPFVRPFMKTRPKAPPRQSTWLPRPS
jgi:NAD(P)-dependent dehydrogenase (short-subunit alcohol dehydrogenase family)